MRSNRYVYRVSYSKRYGTWIVRLPGGGRRFAGRTKAKAVTLGRRLARRKWEVMERPAQLVVHNKNGRIAFEHTYGKDPRRSRG